jgi:hypothetical protein
MYGQKQIRLIAIYIGTRYHGPETDPGKKNSVS